MSGEVDRLERGARATLALVKGLAPEHLGTPTPCADWDVRALVNHTIGAMTMFRDVIDDGAADPGAIFTADLVGDDPAGSFERAVDEVVERFGRPGVLDGTLALPFGEFPAMVGISLLTNDVVVHGWDLARATDQRSGVDDDVVAACTAFAEQLFEDPAMRGDDFGPATEPPPGASALDRLAAYLGRTI